MSWCTETPRNMNLNLPLDHRQSISPGVLGSGSLHTFHLCTTLADTALPTLVLKDFIVRASASPCPWPLLGPLHLFLFPCISSIFVSESARAPVAQPLKPEPRGSMSDGASYCNHWPVPQPPFGPWPPFPRLWAQSFISAEPGPRGRNDFSSLGLQPLSQLKLQKSWQTLLLLLSVALTSHRWHNSARLSECTRQEHGTPFSQVGDKGKACDRLTILFLSS